MIDFLNLYQHLPEKIDPIAMHIGSFSIKWYSLMYLVGLAVVYGLLNVRKKELSLEIIQNSSAAADKIQNSILDLLIYIFIGLLIGARLGYVVFYNLPYYINHPLEAFLPIQFTNYGLLVTGYYGMSYFGGLIGVVSAGYIFARKHGINFLKLADFVVPAIPAGYFFGRIGNFLNGELYGRATGKPWGMYFPADPAIILRHPSQLYEAFFEGLVLFLVLWLLRNSPLRRASMLRNNPFYRPGRLLIIYLFGYGFFRFFIEFFREPDPLRLGSLPQPILFFNFLTLGQVFSAVFIAIAIISFFITKKRKNDV